MNKDVQKRPVPKGLEEKGKIAEILDKDDYLEDELIDKTLYGEYMSTYHYWTSPEEQKKRVKQIERVTEKK